MIKPDTHPTHKKYRWQGKMIVFFAVGFLWAVGVNVWNELLMPKRENYIELHKKVDDIIKRIAQLEKMANEFEFILKEKLP